MGNETKRPAYDSRHKTTSHKRQVYAIHGTAPAGVTNILYSIDQLREQFAAQGYLWLKGILNHDRVLAFRQRYQRLREEIDVRWNNHWSRDDML